MSLNASSIWSCNFFILMLLIFFYCIKKSNGYLHINVHFVLASFILCICRLAVPVEFTFSKTIFFRKILPYFTHFLYDRRQLYGRSFSFGQVFIFIWAAGILLKLLIHIQTFRRFQRWKILSIPYDMDSLTPALNRLAKDNTLPARIEFFRLPVGIGPFYSGILHPKIFLPQGIYTQDELYYIILHEMTHIVHRDLLLKASIEIICIIHWWNPLVYLLKNEIFQFIEIRTDRDISENLDTVQTGDYAECLLKCARAGKSSTSSLQAGIHESSSEFMKLRFSILLKNRNHEQEHVKSLKNIFALSTVLIILFLSVYLVFNSTGPANPERVTPKMYSLEEDDVYVIKTTTGYDIYVNGKKISTVKRLSSYGGIPVPVYNSISEVPK